MKKITRNKLPGSVWTNPLHFIGCGFGVGAVPWMPGTFGTLVGVVAVLLMRPLSLWAYIAVTTALVLVGIYLCHVTNRDFGTHDHSGVVWDEIATFPIVMIAIPKTGYWLLAGFVLFRIFDIWKPWPISWLDREVHGGLGVMIDDVVAAIFAWAPLFIVYKFFYS